jgi:hypothetical protein
MEKEEVLRRLRLVYRISHGSSELLPPLQAKPFTRYFFCLLWTAAGSGGRKVRPAVLGPLTNSPS